MIIVLADDLSGAAEIAGVAFQMGLSAEVHIDQLYSTSCDVAVVDTNSRSVSACEAVKTVSQVAQVVNCEDPQWVYKKTDSVLRGHVLAELKAIAVALNCTRCLLVNANPRKGRVVRDGQLFVGGRPVDQTPFGSDPEHPCRSSWVVELLGGSPGEVSLVDAQRDLPSDGIMIANATSTADLHRFAELSNVRKGIKENILLAGGAEFFESILARVQGSNFCTSSHENRHELRLRQATGLKRLIVSGTSTAAVNEYSINLCLANDDVHATAAEVCRILANNDVATLTAGQYTVQENASVGKSDEPDRLHQRLVETVLAVHARCSPPQYWIEGGRTASSIVRAFGWQRLAVDAVYSDGVVGLRSTFPLAPTVVVKPGSYPWPT